MSRNLLIIGHCDNDIKSFLIEHSFDLMYIKQNTALDDRLVFHADLSVLKFDNSILIDENQYEIIKELGKRGIGTKTIKFYKNKLYPNDCILNFIIVGKNIIGNKKALTQEMLNIIHNRGFVFHHVNQGYAKCSTIVLENAAITNDISIYKKLKSLDIETFLIQNETIHLDRYNCGFIGGSSFVDEKNKIIYFFGDVTSLNEWKNLYQFITEHNYSIEYIKNRALTDIGGAVIIN